MPHATAVSVADVVSTLSATPARALAEGTSATETVAFASALMAAAPAMPPTTRVRMLVFARNEVFTRASLGAPYDERSSPG